MARTDSAAAKPLRSRGYGKIVGLTLVAMFLGCCLMGWEIFVEYGGSVQAVRKPPLKVPASLPPVEKGPAAGQQPPVVQPPVVPPAPNP